MNENSWVYYTDWFWYLGWFEHRFAIESSTYLNLELKPCAREQAAFMQMVLTKIPTTLRERTTARTLQADTRVPDDGVPSEAIHPWSLDSTNDARAAA